MSMNGNPHYGVSAEYGNMARVAGITPDNEAAHLIQEARQEATLALAYEQRTANLIAAFVASSEADGETTTFIGERIDAYELAKTISARLGLDTP